MCKDAKLQKDINGKARYTLIPYIHGGFIIPEKLIKIGEVAKKYDGSIKINSNQKISILNIKEEDIEKVWNELGMEPAVKDKKSVISIEICSSNFCRMSKYPVIGIGTKISKNFYGMKMPNKTTIAVSACKHSCINTYSKDIGIAVDRDGKFLVTLGGTSTLKPRIADVLAEKLDEKEVFEIVKKVLDYYKSNAEDDEKIGKFIDRIGINKLRESALV